MIEKLKRVSAAARLIGILVLVGVLAVAGYQLYDFYEDKVGFTPDRAIQDYFQALVDGDYARVYELTDKESLTDIYGRPISRGEFYEQLETIAGDQRLATLQIQSRKLCEDKGHYYYLVTLGSSLSDQEGRLVLEVTRVGRSWTIGYPFGIVL